MVKWIKKNIWSVLNFLKIGGPLQLKLNGALVENGWFNSFYTKQVIDKEMNPIPWFSYSFTRFLEPRLKNSFKVFEFGSGSSTLWFAERCKEIHSIEHNKNWFKKLTKLIPNNVKLYFIEINEEGNYSKYFMKNDEKFDIIIIDGRDRNNCAFNSIKNLSDDGIIIFDDTERKEYSEAINFLLQLDFYKLDFWGIGPITSVNSCTSVFYRENNCLNI